jgi:drug/metabolite transporter (DMT)-like permease
MGLGPMGVAFYLWDAALKKGDPRHIGVLSYLTPLGSSLLLLWVLDRAFNVLLLCAIVCIVGAGWWSSYRGGKK